MRTFITITLFGLALSFPSTAQETAVTIAQVKVMMDHVPMAEAGPQSKMPFRWSVASDADLGARAIAQVAPSREAAADLVVNGTFESQWRKDAAGPCDPSCAHGMWQLAEVQAPIEISLDPFKAAKRWLEVAEKSRARCYSLPEDEQLAALESGNCAHARAKARHRAEVARAVMSAVE